MKVDVWSIIRDNLGGDGIIKIRLTEGVIDFCNMHTCIHTTCIYAMSRTKYINIYTFLYIHIKYLIYYNYVS